jgi:outer membrane protein assembly factor BamD (BamD/ComL family)
MSERGPRFLTAWSAAFAVVAITAACSTPPPLTLTEAEPRLAAAEAQVASGQWDAAAETLAPLADEACPKRLRDRRDLALASALQGRGELWEAYLVLEKFPDLYAHSERRLVVVEKVWEIGSALVRSDGGFLFFTSDRRAGRTALEHLISRHPDSPRLADALRILGDLAFEDDDHPLAQERYRQLMLDRPESEWVAYAQFRFAMSIVASIEGPDYDLDRMEHGQRELRDFLATKPENPEMVRAASAAVLQLLEWRITRHLFIASFYRQLENVPGQLHHLQLAAGPEFESTSRHTEAVALLADLRRNHPAATAPAGGTPP